MLVEESDQLVTRASHRVQRNFKRFRKACPLCCCRLVSFRFVVCVILFFFFLLFLHTGSTHSSVPSPRLPRPLMYKFAMVTVPINTNPFSSCAFLPSSVAHRAVAEAGRALPSGLSFAWKTCTSTARKTTDVAGSTAADLGLGCPSRPVPACRGSPRLVASSVNNNARQSG